MSQVICCLIILPIYQNRAVAKLASIGAEIRWGGTPQWLDLETNEPNPKKPADRHGCLLFILYPNGGSDL